MAEKTSMVQSKNELSPQERFTQAALRQIKEAFGELAQDITPTHRRLLANYFTYADRMLAKYESDRVRKNEANKDHKYDNTLPYTWQNVMFNEFIQDALHYSKTGLDPLMKNHINFIPYKNSDKTKYVLTPLQGYVGLQLAAEKYGLHLPLSTTIEVVYATDKFKPIKASGTNAAEDYIFEVNNPFSRGEIVGAFGYHRYADPSKNKLIWLTLEQIKKRSPHQNVEFWGGEKDEYNWKGEKTGNKLQVTGWLDEMCEKAMRRVMFSEKNIIIDPEKIDDTYNYIQRRDIEATKLEAISEVDENQGKGDIVEIPAEYTVDDSVFDGEVADESN